MLMQSHSTVTRNCHVPKRQKEELSKEKREVSSAKENSGSKIPAAFHGLAFARLTILISYLFLKPHIEP